MCLLKCLNGIDLLIQFFLIVIFSLNSIYMDVGHSYLEGNADAVDFCPHDSFHNVLAASTYTLQEGDQPSRAGSISLFDVDADACRLNLTHRLETAGIFDIKWNSGFVQNVGHPLLAQADADGYVRIHSLQSSDLDESDVCGILKFSFTWYNLEWSNFSANTSLVILVLEIKSLIQLLDSFTMKFMHG